MGTGSIWVKLNSSGIGTYFMPSPEMKFKVVLVFCVGINSKKIDLLER
jgi:hypothetical protein